MSILADRPASVTSAPCPAVRQELRSRWAAYREANAEFLAACGARRDGRPAGRALKHDRRVNRLCAAMLARRDFVLDALWACRLLEARVNPSPLWLRKGPAMAARWSAFLEL